MENTELIEHLIKEHGYKVDYPSGSKTYELGENDIKHIAQLIVKKLTIPVVSVSLPLDPMVLAKYLHDNYEQIAKITNWQTQKNCKVEFDSLPIENKNTMILLAGKLILDFVGNER